MERLNPHLYADTQLNAGKLIEDDLENVLLAWRWLVEDGDGDGIYRMMDSLHQQWNRSGRCQAGAASVSNRRARRFDRTLSQRTIRPGIRGALSMYEGLLSRRIGVVDQRIWGDMQLLLDDPILHPVHLSGISLAKLHWPNTMWGSSTRLNTYSMKQ